MHVIFVGWLFVIALVVAASLAERAYISALVVFVALGVMPVAVVLSLMRRAQERKRQEAAAGSTAGHAAGDGAGDAGAQP